MPKESPAEIATKYSISPYREGEFVEKDQIYLYLPTSYKPSILIGNPDSSVAIITGWSDPQAVVDSEIMEETAIAASVRTPVGVQLLLANLARNPQITTLVRKSVGSINETDRGKVTINIVDALFKKEYDERGEARPTVDDEGNIIGTEFKLRPELIDGAGISVVRDVLKNVELVDLNHQKNPNILEEVKNNSKNGEPYFPLPVNFREFEPISLQTWPSEQFGVMVRGKEAFSTWIALMDKVIRYGKNATLESETINHPQLGTRPKLDVWELPFAMVVLDGKNPFSEIPKWAEEEESLTLTLEKLENYYQDAYRPEKHKQEIFPGVHIYYKENKYKYGEEMHMYPNNPEAQKLYQKTAQLIGLEVANRIMETGSDFSDETTQKVIEVMNSALSDEQKAWVLSHVYYPPIDQYQIAVDRLKSVPDDADKVIMFYNPTTHGQILSGRPCLNRLGLIARDGLLHGLSEFRTHDSKSWLENVYGVWRTVQDMARESGFGVGNIITVSDSLHIYQQDRNWLVRLWQEQFCNQDIPTVFDDLNSDPRGDISVTKEDGKLNVSLLNPKTGDVVAQFEPKTHREAVAQLSYFGWTSQANHALYIGGELQNALLANFFGVEYTQDRPEATRRAIEEQIRNNK